MRRALRVLVNLLDDIGTALRWGMPTGALLLIAMYHFHLVVNTPGLGR